MRLLKNRCHFKGRVLIPPGLPTWLLAVLAILAGCSSSPKMVTQDSPKTTSEASSQPKSIMLPKAGSGRGAYYKDDGPGDNPPLGLELTLDAEPKLEPYSVSGNKPYVVFGKKYVPITEDRPFIQRGIGSWYGKKFHGQRTSSGELYDMYKMTAAHPTLPIPSYARITNIRNGRQVIVKINDRGPFHSSRIVDLSYTAALKLDYLSKGSSELLLERLLPADIEKMAENRNNTAPVAVADVSPATPLMDTVLAAAAPAPAPVPASAGPDMERFEALVASEAAADAAIPTPPAVIAKPNTRSGYYLQFGAFGLRTNAEATFTHLQNRLAQLPAFEIVQQGMLYRLFSGPFATHEQANHALKLALSAGVMKPVIIQR